MNLHASLLRITICIGVIGLSGCIPAPADIGLDYSGPLHRIDGEPPHVLAKKTTELEPINIVTDCQPLTESPTRKRSACGIENTMTRYNSGLQTLYQRRLADNSSLQGNVVLRMMIAADGSVQGCEVASTDINDPEFMRQITAYVRTVNFGAHESIPAWSDTYTLTFTPQAGTKK